MEQCDTDATRNFIQDMYLRSLGYGQARCVKSHRNPSPCTFVVVFLTSGADRTVVYSPARIALAAIGSQTRYLTCATLMTHDLGELLLNMPQAWLSVSEVKREAMASTVYLLGSKEADFKDWTSTVTVTFGQSMTKLQPYLRTLRERTASASSSDCMEVGSTLLECVYAESRLREDFFVDVSDDDTALLKTWSVS